MSLLPMPFDNPHTYKGHSGVDYPGHAGEPIRASGPGRIVTRGHNSRGGYYVWVQYDAGPRVGYHHMNSHKGTPKPGTRVTEGTVLGYVGWAGNVRPAGRAGAHLHSEVYGHATTAGYWKHFDRNRVVSRPAPAHQEEEDMPLNDADIQKVARAVWEYESRANGRKFGDMLRRAFEVGEALYESVRYGKNGVRTHGTGTADVLSRLGALQLQLDDIKAALPVDGMKRADAYTDDAD